MVTMTLPCAGARGQHHFDYAYNTHPGRLTKYHLLDQMK